MAETRPPKGPGCLRGCLMPFFAVVLLIVLFELEEDWRGAHELAAAKARWASAGYSLEAADYVPPPVPDDKNLAALPIFKLEPDAEENGKLTDVPLHAAVDEDKHGGSLTDSRKKKDLAELVAAAYTKMFPGKTAPASALSQLEELYPVIADLRTAAPTHPEFRLNIDYTSEPAFSRPLGPVVRQIAVAKLLANHAQLALAENQPQVALEDIRINFQIARGVATHPTLVGGLVSVGVAAITEREVVDGLTRHAWNDAQLAQLQDTLKQLDYLADYQFVMRGEVAMFSLPMYVWLKNQPSSLKLIVGMTDAPSNAQGSAEPHLTGLLQLLWSSGWWDISAARTADYMLDAVNGVDLKARRSDPELKQKLDDKLEKSKELPWGAAPWNILFSVMAGPMGNAIEKFSQGQVQLDENRIVCGLERYRLAHGAYPEKLEALVPACIDELPHEVMNGEPYHYQLNADGTFLLYSVGWNLKDDGGKLIFKQNGTNMIDYENGDWVWPMMKR